MENEQIIKTQLAQTIRHYGDMRFKQLTLLMAGVPFLAAGIAIRNYSTIKVLSWLELRGAVPFLGMLFTAVVWVMEVRSTILYNAARAHAKETNPSPNFRRFRKLNLFLHRCLNATTAVFALYISLYVAWWYCAELWYPGRWLFVLFTAAGLVLFVYSFFSYWGGWESWEE